MNKKILLLVVSLILFSSIAAVLFVVSKKPREVVVGYHRPDILLICVDTLRPDHLGLYGYARNTSPNIDKWFGKGTVFERAYAPEANTTPSVVSFLSGLPPSKHGVRFLFQKVPYKLPLVSTLLSERGYQTAAVVSNMVLTSEATNLDHHFDYYDDYVDEREHGRQVYERRAGPTTDAAIKWLGTYRDKEKPSFLYVHYMDPHGPYSPPDPKPTDFSHTEKRIIDIEKIKEYQRHEGVLDGNEYVDLYDEEIAYTDREIGRLLSAYEKTIPTKKALIIFTADHGESMMEHEQWFTHGYHVYEEVIKVPLAIKGPGFEEARVSSPVSIQDLAPTILKSAGKDLKPDKDKRALSMAPGKRDVYSEATLKDVYSDKTESSEITQRRCLIRDEEKWVINLSKDNHGKAAPVYYDLKADPKELSPTEVAASSPDWLGLKKRIEKDKFWTAKKAVTRYGRRIKAPKVAPGVDEETLKKLRALGYVE